MLSPQWSLSWSCTIAPWSPLCVWHGGGRLCLVSNRCNRQSHLLSPVQYSRCGILLCCRCHRRLYPPLLFLIMTMMNHHCHIVVLTACANSCAIAVAVAASATLELPLRLNARQIVTFVVRAFPIETRGLRSGFVQSIQFSCNLNRLISENVSRMQDLFVSTKRHWGSSLSVGTHHSGLFQWPERNRWISQLHFGQHVASHTGVPGGPGPDYTQWIVCAFSVFCGLRIAWHAY